MLTSPHGMQGHVKNVWEHLFSVEMPLVVPLFGLNPPPGNLFWTGGTWSLLLASSDMSSSSEQLEHLLILALSTSLKSCSGNDIAFISPT